MRRRRVEVGFNTERVIEIGGSILIGSLWPRDRGEVVVALTGRYGGSSNFLLLLFFFSKLVWGGKILPCDSFSGV